MKKIIAIDGPAASGKSTIAREIAKKINFYYLDSGAYYRAVTYFLFCIYKQKMINVDFESWTQSKESFKFLEKINIKYEFSSECKNKMYLDGKNINEFIRTEEVSKLTKVIAENQKYRKFINIFLRKLGSLYSLVMDGRDIGSEVFPNAMCKFFMTASLETRTERRYLELKNKKVRVDRNQIKKDIEERDFFDINRKIAPLVQVDDAILIDTDKLSKEQVVDNCLKKITHFFK